MVHSHHHWFLYAKDLAHGVETQPSKWYRKLCVRFTVAGEYLLRGHGLKVAHHDMHLSHLTFETRDLRHLGVAVLVHLSLLLLGGLELARGGIGALFGLEANEQVAKHDFEAAFIRVEGIITFESHIKLLVFF